jgi:hypothetical protein
MMVMRIAWALGVAALFATQAAAGVIYDFVTTFDASRVSERVSGRVWANDQSYRAEFVRGGSPSVVISNDGDQTAVLLDPRKQTWSNRSRATKDVRASGLFVWPIPGAYVKGKPTITYHRVEPSLMAGQKAVEHVIELSFVVESRMSRDRLRGTFLIRAHVWAAEELPALPMQHAIRTGYPSVDQEMEAIDRKIVGMVVRHDLEITRTFDGGPPQRERTSTVIERMEIGEIDPSQFEVPTAYNYAGPVTPRRD